MLEKIKEWMDRRSLYSHILMAGVGAYLLYAIYMIMNRESGNPNKVVIAIACGVFSVLGVAMIVIGGIPIATGHYKENFMPRKKRGDDDKKKEENDGEDS